LHRFNGYSVFAVVFIACLLVQGWTWLNYWPLCPPVRWQPRG